MLRPRFLWKLYASYLALLMLSIAIVGMLVPRHTSQTIHDTVRDTLQTQAFLLRQLALKVLDASDPQSFSPDLRSLGAAISTHITIIQPNGTVVADSEDDPSRLQNYARRPEIVAARQRDTTGTDIRIGPRLGESTMYLAQPVRRQDELLGYIRTAMPLTILHERLVYIWRTVIIAGSGAAVIGLLFSVLFARQVAHPLQRMTEMATQLAGQYAPQLAFMRSKDEIENLSNAFDRMAHNLHDRMETIIKDRNQLLTVLGGMVEGVIAVDEHDCDTYESSGRHHFASQPGHEHWQARVGSDACPRRDRDAGQYH